MIVRQKAFNKSKFNKNQAIQAITATQTSATQAVTAEVDKIVEKSKRFLNVLTKLNNKSMALTLLKVIQQQIRQKSKLTDDYGKAIESSEQSIDSV